jgi:ribosomal protein L37E
MSGISDDLGPDEALSPGDRYQINVDGTHTAGGNEILAKTQQNGLVAGHTIRRMFEKKGYDSSRPVFLGYDDTARGAFREIGFPFDAFKRHLWVSGTTGAGKTTVLHNKAVQHAFGNHGFCNIDPKADGDTVDLLRKIPRVRLDDVIFIEPGSSEFDRTIGINILDVPAIENSDEREKEIENRLENLTAIFDNDDYWGPTMASITESMGRAMLRHNAEVSLDPDRDPSEKYSVIDMYFILLQEERRIEFAESVDDPYLKDFLRQIADMKDEEVRPLLKRIKRWVENPIVRRIIAQRESTIDWDEIVDEGKIVLVRIPVDSKDVHQMITLTVLRNIWSAKKRQVRDEDRPTTPYFIQVDEFEKVANDNLNMDGMLARARSFWLSVALGTQYPQQIKSDHEDILRAMENNCNTLLAMKTPGSQDASLLMERFPDYNKTDLINTDKHRMWTKIPLDDGRESEPLNVKTFPPYPPLRNEDAAVSAIKQSLQEYGTMPVSEHDIQSELKVGGVGELSNPESAGFEDLASSNDTDISLDMILDETFLEAIFAAQIRFEGADAFVDGVDAFVPKSKVETELANRVGDVGFKSEISNVFEKSDQIITGDRINGEVSVKLTEQGLNSVLSHDTGSSASGGGDDHRWVLKQSYKAFTLLGALTSLPTQEGDELPDGVADLPRDPMEEATTVEEANQIRGAMIDDYPRLWELSNGRDIAIEAETSTIKKPMQTLTNLRKAIEVDKTCIFTCKDASGDDVDGHGLKHWPTRGERIIYESDGGEIDYGTINCVPKTYPNGDRAFYNKTSSLKIDSSRVVVAPKSEAHSQLLWREQNNAIVALSRRSGEKVKLMQFSSPQMVADPPMAKTVHREKLGDEWIVKTGDGDTAEIKARYPNLDALQEEWMDLYEPFIPDVEFPRPVEDGDFTFVAFPDANNPDHDKPMVVYHGRMEPLFGEGREVDGKSSTAESGSATLSADQSSPTTAEATDKGEATTPTSESEPIPSVNPHELTDQFNTGFGIEQLGTWATGTIVPQGDDYSQLVDLIERANPDAAAWIDGPQDVPQVLGNGKGGSEAATRASESDRHPADETDASPESASDDEPITCKQCGSETFETTGSKGNLGCAECGYVPQKHIREKIPDSQLVGEDSHESKTEKDSKQTDSQGDIAFL